MALIASTPLSSLGSEAELASSEQLYGFLGDILKDVRTVTSKSQMDSYATLLNSLIENFLLKLPGPSKSTWTSQSEAIKLTDRSIDIIKEVISKVEDFIESNSNIVIVALKGLFHLICTLNVWVSESQARQQTSDSTATDSSSLRRKAILCIVSIVVRLGNPIKLALARRSHGNLHVQHILGGFADVAKGRYLFLDISTFAECFQIF